MTLVERLNTRLDQEERLLVKAFPTARIDRDSHLVVLPDYELPAGWSCECTDVAFTLPTSYPAGCPDNVLARSDLHLASGQQPGNNQGIHTYAGRQWLQFSWHIDAADWHPSATPDEGSNLVTYLIGALTRFDEAT